MARTKIDWCDSVWNPVWGCLHGCNFCYARKLKERYRKDFETWLKRIEGYCQNYGIALFEKEACGKYKGNLVREFPFDRRQP